jgi:thiosulfate/3-mercaptopyruvate sulfurtransferase
LWNHGARNESSQLEGERMNVRSHRLLGAGLFVVALSITTAFAQGTSPLLVDTVWLTQHLSDRDLVVLHVGSKSGYDMEHIRGARHITDGDLVGNANGGLYDLLEPGELRTKLSARGISDDSRIVVYGGIPNVTRVILTLDYLGLGDRTSLLNGGLNAWKRAGGETTAAPPAIVPGKLSQRPTINVVTDAELVKAIAQRPGHRLIDARAPVYYTGIEADHDKIGHIPGAINIPFSSIPGTDSMIDRARLAEMFRNAGIKSGETIVVYCHVGQQATAVVFAARLLGHPVLLYDGSFHDWAMNNRGPVEK